VVRKEHLQSRATAVPAAPPKPRAQGE
jgi:hypothetical protein